MQETKIWKVVNNQLNELKSTPLDLEVRLHNWLEQDIKILLPDAILLGSKVKTDHGKEIDLLAIDNNGDLVIIELKKHSTTRDVIGQILDYASWVQTLTPDDLTRILQKNGKTESVYEILNKNFDNGEEIEINENQKLIIVASEIDIITERIVSFLSSKGLNINAVTFNYYKENNDEFIARNFLIKTEEVYTKDENKRSGRFITRLFNESKLQIGQKINYVPLSKVGITATATIFRKGSNCLEISNSDEKFSFSKLRAKYIIENQLNLNAYFPYNQWNEWELIDSINGNVKLSEL